MAAAKMAAVALSESKGLISFVLPSLLTSPPPLLQSLADESKAGSI